MTLQTILSENEKKKSYQICKELTSNKDYGNGPICDKCAADGWTANPAEIQEAILKDPLLKDKVSHQSPFL